MRTLAIVLFAAALQARTVVWIDSDPSMAVGGVEIDDGLAWIQAFHSREISVRGVSIVFGNAALPQAMIIAQKFLPQLDKKTRPVAGASGAAELGMETPASASIEEALKKEKLTILAIGPLTNIATVLKNHPELAARITRVVAVAGRRPGQHFQAGAKGRPLRDFNFEMDPEAFRILLASGVAVTLAPWEISSKVWLRSGDVLNFRNGGPALRALEKPAADWLNLWHKSFGVDGFNPFDTLAVAVVTTPDLIRCEQLPVEIRDLPDDTKDGATKPYLLAAKEIASTRKVEYCYEPKPAFQPDLLKRLLKD